MALKPLWNHQHNNSINTSFPDSWCDCHQWLSWSLCKDRVRSGLWRVWKGYFIRDVGCNPMESNPMLAQKWRVVVSENHASSFSQSNKYLVGLCPVQSSQSIWDSNNLTRPPLLPPASGSLKEKSTSAPSPMGYKALVGLRQEFSVISGGILEKQSSLSAASLTGFTGVLNGPDLSPRNWPFREESSEGNGLIYRCQSIPLG